MIRRLPGLLLLCAALAPSALRSQSPTVPDSTAVAARQRITILPVLGAAPETGGQYGVAIFLTRPRPASEMGRPSSVTGNAIRTAKEQTRTFLEADLWSRGNTWRLQTTAIWQEFPLPYFGIGDGTADAAEEVYTPRGTELNVSVQRLIRPSLWMVAGVRRIEMDIVRTVPGGVLESGSVYGSEGGRNVMLTTGLVHDTRDNLFAPHSGRLAELTVTRSAGRPLSDFSFTRVRLDARAYRAFAGENVLAVQVAAQTNAGRLPFDQFALVGSNTIMRGYVQGRFRDQALAAVQAEYRSPTIWRLGGAVFAGAGFSAPSLSELGDARLLPTYGAGVRFRMNQAARSTVRVDYAHGIAGQSGFYVVFNEAF